MMGSSHGGAGVSLTGSVVIAYNQLAEILLIGLDIVGAFDSIWLLDLRVNLWGSLSAVCLIFI